MNLKLGMLVLLWLQNNTKHADYNTTVNSWNEQRTYITGAPALLRKTQPKLAASIEKALVELQTVTPASTDGLIHLEASDVKNTEFVCGGITIGFDAHGALNRLSQPMAKHSSNDGRDAMADAIPAMEWANSSRPIGTFLYQTFTNKDFNIFLQDFSSRLGDWQHGKHNGCWHNPDDADDMGCGNFRKPNMSSAKPVHRELPLTMDKLWYKPAAVAAVAAREGGPLDRGPLDRGPLTSCSFVVEGSFPQEAQELAGAPKKVVTAINVDASGTVDFDVVWIDKRPTRLAESIFFSFQPAVAAGSWLLRILNTTMDPTDVLGKKGADEKSSIYGGSPHLHGVEAVEWGTSAAANGPSFVISSLDVPIVSTGIASPFVSPRTEAPDMRGGVHYNILQNIWNTNYVLW
jgi:hypothetical protein